MLKTYESLNESTEVSKSEKEKQGRKNVILNEYA